MAEILPFGAVQAAELADADVKREATALAHCCLLGITIRKITLPDGQVAYGCGLRRFANVEQLEDFLDEIRGGIE